MDAQFVRMIQYDNLPRSHLLAAQQLCHTHLSVIRYIVALGAICPDIDNDRWGAWLARQGNWVSACKGPSVAPVLCGPMCGGDELAMAAISL